MQILEHLSNWMRRLRFCDNKLASLTILTKDGSVRIQDAIRKQYFRASAFVMHKIVTLAYHKILIRSARVIGPTMLTDDLIASVETVTGGRIYYSQEGEDIILQRIFGDKVDGFFVDVGAHHPTRFSNTYALYRRGWRGLNIDATPGCMAAFKTIRPEDTNVECAISDRIEQLRFHLFDEGALNTLDEDLAESYAAAGYSRREVIDVVAKPLADILYKHVPPGRSIDLLSIDAEGRDLAVLQSNDWARYTPEIVIIEVLDTPLSDLPQHACVTFLAEKGYVTISRLTNSLILQRCSVTCAD